MCFDLDFLSAWCADCVLFFGDSNGGGARIRPASLARDVAPQRSTRVVVRACQPLKANAMPAQPRVYVLDDDPAVTRSLRRMIESAGLTVETFHSAREFLAACSQDWPGCLITDARMPGMTGVELLEQLAALKINLPAIVISGEADVSTAVRAMKSGAVDFLEKPFNHQLLLDRIQHALALDQQRRKEQAHRDQIEARIAQLTPKQREVLDLVVAGKANKHIATLLGRSEKTIEHHRANVMRKLAVGSLAELVCLVQDGRRRPDGS